MEVVDPILAQVMSVSFLYRMDNMIDTYNPVVRFWRKHLSLRLPMRQTKVDRFATDFPSEMPLMSQVSFCPSHYLQCLTNQNVFLYSTAAMLHNEFNVENSWCIVQ